MSVACLGHDGFQEIPSPSQSRTAMRVLCELITETKTQRILLSNYFHIARIEAESSLRPKAQENCLCLVSVSQRLGWHGWPYWEGKGNQSFIWNLITNHILMAKSLWARSSVWLEIPEIGFPAMVHRLVSDYRPLSVYANCRDPSSCLWDLETQFANAQRHKTHNHRPGRWLRSTVIGLC